MDLMKLYIEQGRFGEFVYEVITAENKRKQEQAEKEEDNKLWTAYLLSEDSLNKTFKEWKESIISRASHNSSGKRDDDMTNADIDNLLNRLFPEN